VNKRGFGSIYRRGAIFWIRFWHRGVEYRESSGSDNEAAAVKLLKQRIRETGRPGRFLGPAEEKVRYEDLQSILTTDYTINGRRSARKLNCYFQHLAQAFSTARAIDITTDRIQTYVADRQQAGATNATINRELSALKRSFHLAIQAGRLAHAPHIALLEEHNARQGFLEPAAFTALREQLPPHLRDAISFLYLTGWRVSEMRSLEWRDVDFAGSLIRLRAENSKNKRAAKSPSACSPNSPKSSPALAKIAASTAASSSTATANRCVTSAAAGLTPAPPPASAKCWSTIYDEPQCAP
jgi:hypothetical protein